MLIVWFISYIGYRREVVDVGDKRVGAVSSTLSSRSLQQLIPGLVHSSHFLFWAIILCILFIFLHVHST